jgi:ketosteroid isomerase-like protein
VDLPRTYASEVSPSTVGATTARPIARSVAVPGTARQQDAVLAAYRFLDAFNERDPDALAALVTEDVEIRTSDGRVWPGVDGARALLDAARENKLRLIPLHRHEHAEDHDGEVRVELWVREVLEDADVPRIADFVVRDGDVASFAMRDAPFEPGLA